jgi:hypothetical protein
MYRNAVLALAALTVALGAAILIVTISRGGGVGLLLGVLFIAAGSLRIWLIRRRPR